MGRKIIILLGHPGAGKGTQAKEIMRCLKIPQISTGDMLRDAVARKTSFGKEAQEKMQAGELVSDAVVNGIVAERIEREDCRMGFILDGYPRTVKQAVTFEQKLKPSDRLFVIEIAGDASNTVGRLLGRLMCPNCGEIYNVYSHAPKREGVCDRCGAELVRRSDDCEDVILERLKNHQEETYPLVEHYRKTGCYHEVNGMRPIAEVTKEILEIAGGVFTQPATPRRRLGEGAHKGRKGSIA